MGGKIIEEHVCEKKGLALVGVEVWNDMQVRKGGLVFRGSSDPYIHSLLFVPTDHGPHDLLRY